MNRSASRDMGTLKTVLMLSRFFPPAFDIGGKRAYRFARYLPDYGWRAAILTDVAPAPSRADPSAGLPLPAAHSIHRSWYPQTWPRPETADSDGTASAPTRSQTIPPDKLYERLRWHLQMPFGRELTIAPRAGWLIKRLAEQEQAQAIFATSSPYAALAYGALGKALTQLPLHLDLRDPWSMNFLQERKSPWTRWSEARVEAALLRRANRISFTSQTAAAAYREKYPEIAERIGYIYNSFDPEQRPSAAPPRDPAGQTTLVHFGNCYGVRRLDTVLKAIARLRDDDGIGPDTLKLTNLGRMAAEDVELIARLSLTPFVEARAVIPYEEGLRVLAAADLQLLLAYRRERLFIPAKLYDYLLSGAPILCVAPASEVTEIVARTGSGLSVAPAAVDDAARVLRQAIVARRAGKPLVERNEGAIETFSARTTAKELAAQLDEMVATAPHR